MRPGPGIRPIIFFVSAPDGLHLIGSGNTPKSVGDTISLLSLVERGQGLIILDATRLGARDWNGPDGDSYDAARFYQNVKLYAGKASSPRN